MLTTSKVETFYGSSQALFDLTIEIGPSEVVTLLGRNGMGKTTSVHSIMGILPIAAGEILFEGRQIHNLPSFQISRAGIGLVPEGRQVFPNLTVRENLVAVATKRNAKPATWTIERVINMFPELGTRFHSMASLLSGGEQQMLSISRTLMTNPKLLILDEATEGLAPLPRRKIWDCLDRLKSEGQAILVIDKNLDDLNRIADRHYVMETGRIAWTGTPSELQKRPDILSEKLGI